ncbi:MAG: carboxypeptidase regulatory-like domain-containing protein [Candidatus Omnitrophota bacterium]
MNRRSSSLCLSLIVNILVFSTPEFLKAEEPQTQYLTFSHGIVRTTKEPTQHSRAGGSFGLGDVGDVVGIDEVGIGIGLDTFWAVGGGNQKTDIVMKVDWDFTKDDLNEYNVGFAGKYLVPRVPLGALKVSTQEFHYQRQLGFSTHVGLDLNVQGTWYNGIGSIAIADLGIDINDTANEKIGPDTGSGNDPGVYGSDAYYHSDSVMITDLATLANGAATKIVNLLQKAGISALSGYGASVTKDALEWAFEKALSFSAGVNATQRTFNRWMEFDVSARAKDMNGNSVQIELQPNHIVVDDESVEHILYAQLPEECPPLGEIELVIGNAVYHFKDQGNVEIGIRSSYISLTTGAISQDLFDTNSYDIQGGTGLLYEVKADPLVFVPFTGFVETGNPPTALQGVTATMTANDGSFHQSTLTGPAGDFWGDFYIPDPQKKKTVPAATITLEKEGYSTMSFSSTDAGFREEDGTYRFPMEPSDPNSVVKVSGRVLDLQGAGIAGAEVSVTGPHTQWTVSNASGNFVFGSVPRADSLTLGVNKTGYSIPHQTLQTQEGVQEYTVDLQSQTGQLMGAIKMQFSTVAGASLPRFVSVQHENGQSYSCGLQGDGTLAISVFDTQHKTLSVSHDGYTFDPATITASFSGAGGETKQFNVTVLPTAPHSVTLTSSRATIEGGGSVHEERRPEEVAALTATVQDAAGRALQGVNVRFDLLSATNVGSVKFSSIDPAFGSGRGYAVTNAQGIATVDVYTANTTIQDANIKLNARAFLPGMPSDESSVISGDLTINVIPSTRVMEPNKPTASISIVTNTRGVTSALGIPTVESGGEFIFNLAAALGNPQITSFFPAGTIVGYRIGISKDGGAWQDTDYPGYPPAALPQVFDQTGSYKAGFMVAERCGETVVWSDRVEASFAVVEFTPPTVSLTLPNTTGAVNLPLHYSFNVTANGGATLKTILLEFGDNKMDFNIDQGILSGKAQWSGSYHHTYDTAGTYTIRLVGTDANDRTRATTQEVTIGSIADMNDTTAPTGSITINEGAASTASRSVIVRITASDDPGGVGIFRYRFSNDGTNWEGWQSANFPDDIPVATLDKQQAWTLSDSGGAKTVYCQLKDAAENVSATMSANITYGNSIDLGAAAGDGASPGIYPGNDQTMYTWDHEAPSGSISVTAVNGATASLALDMNDGGTAPHPRMCFSPDGAAWTAWEEFSSSKDVGLVSGQTQIFVKYADGVGNVSPVYSTDIPASGAAPAAEAQAQETEDGGQSQAEQGQAEGAEQNEGAGAGQPEAAPGGEAMGEQSLGADWKIEKMGLSEKPVAGKKMFILVGLATTGEKGRGAADLIFRPEGGSQETQRLSLDGKKNEEARFDWQPAKPGRNELYLEIRADGDPVADNNSTREEIDVEGREEAAPEAKPDAAVREILSEAEVRLGQSVRIEVMAGNLSEKEISDCEMTLSDEQGFHQQERLSLKAQGEERVKFEYRPQAAGRQTLKAVLKCKEDVNGSNDERTRELQVLDEQKGSSIGEEKKEKGLFGGRLEKEERLLEERR